MYIGSVRLFNSSVFASIFLAAVVSGFAQAPAGGRGNAADRSKPKPLTGEMHIQYYFAEAGEASPYRLYVPTTYDGKTALSLIVIFHGGGQSEDTPFTRTNGQLQKLAEEHGYIVISPFGYRSTAFFGNTWPIPKGSNTAAPATDQQQAYALAEKDVLNLIDITEKEYKIDPAHVFLMGNSMGGQGIFHLAAKYPDRWAAIAPSDCPLDPAFYPFDKIKNIPAMYVHGDADKTYPVEMGRAMVEAMKAHGENVTYVEVKGGEHPTSWPQVLPQIIEFFDQHKK
jgi:poly(3-hydroxybutyrate) depolymerase